MKKFKDILLIISIVIPAVFLAKLIIKLLIDNNMSLFGISGIFVGLSLPIILLFFEVNFTRKSLIMVSFLYPFVMCFMDYFIHNYN